MGSWAGVFGKVSREFPQEEQTTEGAAQPAAPSAPTPNPAIASKPAGLSPDVMQGVSNLTGNQGGYQVGPVTYQPIRTWSGGGVEQGGGWGDIESVIAYNTADANQVGKSYQVYDKNGAYQRDGQFQEVNNGRDFMQALAGAAAIYGLGGMMSAASAGGAGGLAGETLSKAALDGTTAFGANSVPGAFELGTAGAGATGAGSGLGSGLSDLGLGNIADAGIVNSPFSAGAGAASAPLPMGAGGWAAATMPAAGSTAATGMMFDPTAGLAAGGAGAGAGGAGAGAGGAGAGAGAGGGSTWSNAVNAAETVADNPLTKLGVQTALATAAGGGAGASGELTPEQKAALYRNRQIGNLNTSWRR